MILFDLPTSAIPAPADEVEPRHDVRVEEYSPRHDVRIDTMFWQHRSPFAGTQEQLDELKVDAEARAVERARADFADYFQAMRAQSQPSTLELHRPAIRRLKPIVHVGLVPMLWAITTCKCGERWPCNDIKQYLRRRLGWTTDITDHLKDLTDRLPKPATRWKRLRRSFIRRRRRLSGF